MAADLKIPSNVDAIEAEMAKVQERLMALGMAKKKAMDEAKDAGRSTLLAALKAIKIAEHSKDDAKVIAKAIEKFGPSKVAELLRAK